MSEIRSYTGIDKETYKELATLSRENKIHDKSTMIHKIEKSAKSNGKYTEVEKNLVQDLKEQLTDKNNTIEIRSAKIDPTSKKINFSLMVEGEKGIARKGVDTVLNGLSKLDIPIIKENKKIAKEEVMSKLDTLTNDVANSYIDSKIGNGKLSQVLKSSVSGVGIVSSTILATGIDLVPDNAISIALSSIGAVSKTSQALSSVTKGKLSTTAISGGKTTPKDFRFINLSYKDEKRVAIAYQAIKESNSDIKAICTYLRNDKELADPKKLETIKKYLFDNKEFQPDPDIAMAWNRLRTGAAIPPDKKLLQHEFLEISLREANPGMGYKQAHAIANDTHDWADELRNFEKIKK